jgi:hypothetical protein
MEMRASMEETVRHKADPAIIRRNLRSASMTAGCCKNRHAKVVMPGLDPGIHVFAAAGKKDVDGRDKPGHDEN